MKNIYLIMLLIIISCVVIKQPYGHAYGYRHKNTFWYYPDCEVYYNTETKVYFIFKDNKWVQSEKPYCTLKTYVVIKTEDDKPYLKHHIFKEKYKSKGKKK